MGRYYWGDIEGKFYFGVQSSYDPEYFGSKALPIGYWSCGCTTEITGKPAECGCELKHEHSKDCPEDCNKTLEENIQNEEFSLIEFSFDKSQIEEVKEKLDKLLDYFKSSKEGTDFLNHIINQDFEYIKEHIGIDNNHYYEVYYRYEIGKEIYDCLLENGSCTFEADV
jgi:hypothetical protein